MKVSDTMSRHVDYAYQDATLKDVAKLIFGRGVNGVPVVDHKKKLIGFVTEKDILSKFYPSMQEYMEDSVHSSDFEAMEERVDEILEMTVDKIMTKNPVTITADTPLLRAQSTMFVKKIGRLPVVDEKNTLIGIISKGDIFKMIVGEKISFAGEEEFYDWLSKYYDELYDWEKRLNKEMPDIVSLFKKEKITSVLDVASSTGEHTIALANRSFRVLGLEASNLMHKIAEGKRKKLPDSLKDKVTFFTGSYKKRLEKLPFRLDAAIFMGNALSAVMGTYEQILENVVNVLNRQNPVLVFQSINFEKIFKVKNGFRDFNITQPRHDTGSRYGVLSFYTKESDKDIFITRAIFNLVGRRWMFLGIRSSSVVRIEKDELITKLKKLGFSKFSFYGSSIYQPIFKYPFEPLESDWLNVVARR